MVITLVFVMTVVACRQSCVPDVDRCNDISYSFHYRNLDSTLYYAREAVGMARDYDGGRAEGLNNIAFVDIMRMRYDHAYAVLDTIYHITDNEIELCVADIQMMRLCQRESRNKEFYDYHQQARKRMLRIAEEETALSERQRRRMTYARTEMNIVASTYFYYVGLGKQSREELEKIQPDGEVQRDTAQYLAYLYNVGAGGIINTGSKEEINQNEFDHLVRCYIMARRGGYLFWQANSLQSVSEHLIDPASRTQLIESNMPAMKFINSDNMPDSLLAGNLAQRSLELFTEYGDVYQIAGSYRTLAQCYWGIDDYRSAIICLNKALNENKRIEQAPDLVASIREQLCVAYSAIDDKQNSDYNRNKYLDLQEQTRQDRYLESRAGQLERSSRQLNIMITAVGAMIVLVCMLLWMFDYLKRRNIKSFSLDKLMEPLETWREGNTRRMEAMEEQREEIDERYGILRLDIQRNKRKNVEQRAKIFLVNSIMPLIDRMIHEINRIRENPDAPNRQERIEYIREITDKINEYNGVLTQWIQMDQGELKLHIESFPLQTLFDIVAGNKMSFHIKGINLIVEPTDNVVKADRILTLFMINTIADNARKFTGEGGSVTISSRSMDDRVEVCVADTGCGMDEKQLSTLFDHKTYSDHGFGLMNCKGIIEKYRKTSRIFDVCGIHAESKPGQGTKLMFTLPKGVARVVAALAMVTGLAMPMNTHAATPADNHVTQAMRYADSAYYSNINAQYEKTIYYADKSRQCVNEYIHERYPASKLTIDDDFSAQRIPEIQLYRDSMLTDTLTDIILDFRNESAVAALALHEWDRYAYNNKVYTQLFKEKSADSSLADYCRVMQRSENNKTVAVILLLLLLVSVLPLYYFIYYRHRIYFNFCIDKVEGVNDILLSDKGNEEKLVFVNSVDTERFPEKLRVAINNIVEALTKSVEMERKNTMDMTLAEDECQRAEYENQKLYVCNRVLDNCLSTLKHETMYYPSRIRQLICVEDFDIDTVSELANYYKSLYTMLSTQTMRLMQTVRYNCAPVPVDKIAGSPEMSDMQALGDRDLLEYLFQLLHKNLKYDKSGVKITEEAKGYLDIILPVGSMSGNDSHTDFFTPSTANIPFMICRQIVRDNGETTLRRGCGIVTRHDGNDFTMRVRLTLA